MLSRDFFWLLDGGVLVAVFATAAVTLRYRALPRWFGYLSLLVAQIFLTPAFAVAFPAFRDMDARAFAAHTRSRVAPDAAGCILNPPSARDVCCSREQQALGGGPCADTNSDTRPTDVG